MKYVLKLILGKSIIFAIKNCFLKKTIIFNCYIYYVILFNYKNDIFILKYLEHTEKYHREN